MQSREKECRSLWGGGGRGGEREEDASMVQQFVRRTSASTLGEIGASEDGPRSPKEVLFPLKVSHQLSLLLFSLVLAASHQSISIQRSILIVLDLKKSFKKIWVNFEIFV